MAEFLSREEFLEDLTKRVEDLFFKKYKKRVKIDLTSKAKDPGDVTKQYSKFKNITPYKNKGVDLMLKPLTDKQVEEYFRKQAKAPFASDIGAKAFEVRKNRITELVKSKKYYPGEINEILKKEFPDFTTGSQTMINNIAKKLKINLGRPPSKLQTKLIEDLNLIVKDQGVINVLSNPNFDPYKQKDLNRLIKQVKRVTKLPMYQAAGRTGQLISDLTAGEVGYLKNKDPKLVETAQRLSKSLIGGRTELLKDGATKRFGGTYGALQRKWVEAEAAKQIGEKRTYFSQLRKRIQEIINSKGAYEVDEIKSLASSAQYRTAPYSLFTQVIKKQINQAKERKLDKKLIQAEKDLAKLSPRNPNFKEEATKIIEKYNNEVDKFVEPYNKNLTKNDLKVTGLKLSLEPPSKTVERYSGLPDELTDLFDDVYEKKGYSFEVPKDVLTLPEAKTNLKINPNFVKIVNLARQSKNPRILGITAAPVIGYGAYEAVKNAFTPLEAAETKPQVAPLGELEALGQNINVKPFDEYNPETYPSNEEQKVNLEKYGNYILAAGAVAGATQIPKGYNEARALGRGKFRSAIGITGGLGKVLTATGTPGVAIPYEVTRMADKISKGASASEILMPRLEEQEKEEFFDMGFGGKAMTATKPLIDSPYLSLAFLEPLSKTTGVITKSGEAAPGILSKVLRLGLNPRTIAGISRFAGLPGLALSAGLTAYDLYKAYQDRKEQDGSE